jgi:site-specific recombinase XerD
MALIPHAFSLGRHGDGRSSGLSHRGIAMGKFYDLMDRELRIRGFAESTRINYLERMRCLVRHFRKPPDQLGPEQVKQYLLFLATQRRLKWSTFNLYVCSFRFFYRHVLRVSWDLKVDIPYQRTGKRLPVVLSGEEVLKLLDAANTLKHRAILMTLYAAGLRVSEATHLRPADIDSQRMMIRVAQGKGRKDRYVMLSAKLLETLRCYWREERLQERPDTFLFPGKKPGVPLTRDAVEWAFAAAQRHAGIAKPVSPHSLRHSFATHLLERGVNIRIIQKLLGHRTLGSTEIYTHVAQTYIRDTHSPLDDLLPEVAEATLPPE